MLQEMLVEKTNIKKRNGKESSLEHSYTGMNIFFPPSQNYYHLAMKKNALSVEYFQLQNVEACAVMRLHEWKGNGAMGLTTCHDDSAFFLPGHLMPTLPSSRGTWVDQVYGSAWPGYYMMTQAVDGSGFAMFEFGYRGKRGIHLLSGSRCEVEGVHSVITVLYL
ncbi:hypothetical protein CYMTET_21414 [Cymbomonas tetramitiformis]|uniref:Uncharacterized protein n=1 Tax=Cymbomonas tetramitiformis TaxID=36881 RepID=A0AAE0G2W0_9CHLO|nr:hypothetical protein CYMTET_21414 [Cymbomonas tetramitiformis]